MKRLEICLKQFALYVACNVCIVLVDRISNKRVCFAVSVKMVLSIDERVDGE